MSIKSINGDRKKRVALFSTLCVINKMAKEYCEKLSSLLKEIDIKNEITKQIEVKHFFSGAALYVNKKYVLLGHQLV